MLRMMKGPLHLLRFIHVVSFMDHPCTGFQVQPFRGSIKFHALQGFQRIVKAIPQPFNASLIGSEFYLFNLLQQLPQFFHVIKLRLSRSKALLQIVAKLLNEVFC